jgi:nicotinamide mononucleotide adenylyltransferase
MEQEGAKKQRSEELPASARISSSLRQQVVPLRNTVNTASDFQGSTQRWVANLTEPYEHSQTPQVFSQELR